MSTTRSNPSCLKATARAEGDHDYFEAGPGSVFRVAGFSPSATSAPVDPDDSQQSRPIRARTAVTASWGSGGPRGKGSQRRWRRGDRVPNRPQRYCTARSTKQGGMTGLIGIQTVWVRNGRRCLRPCEPEGTEHHGRDDCNETHVRTLRSVRSLLTANCRSPESFRHRKSSLDLRLAYQ